MNISTLLSPDNFRHERKYLIRSEYENLLYISLKKHPSVLGSDYPARYVNNIYLDTNEYSHYWDNVEGLSKRVKVRIRWYGDSFGPIHSPVLEFKIKDNMLGSKVSFPMTGLTTIDSSLSIEHIYAQFKLLPIASPIKEYLLTLQLTLMNRYCREYFVSQDGDFRFTVDSDISFTKLNNNENYYVNKINYPYSKVLELKYNSDLDFEASRVSSAIPFRISRSSKYIFGMHLLKIL